MTGARCPWNLRTGTAAAPGSRPNLAVKWKAEPLPSALSQPDVAVELQKPGRSRDA